MRSAVLGGSFNPVHNAHLHLARAVRDIGYERIIFVPAADPPHKRLSGGATDRHRVEMLSIAIEGLNWAMLWEGELHRDGKSYTIDTIRELKASGLLDERPGLIVGDDLAGGFADWKDAKTLAEETTIILARRGTAEVDFPFPCVRLRNGVWPDSSTEARRRISAGKGLEGLVPAEVARYIARNGLYERD